MAGAEEVPAMPRRLTAAPHLPLEELERRYRAARDPVARTHWQIVWLVAAGRTCPQVAAVAGYSVDWVRAVLGRYNREGPAGLGDRRHANPGAAPLLTAAQQEELRAALAGPAPDGGLWTCRKVADWIGARVGRPVAEARGWEYLRRLGFSPQRPRPRATAADPAAQEAFKKGGSARPWRR
jgi:transposase